MKRRDALLALAGLALAGCGTTAEPVWYKPGGNYTTAEFRRDRESCTRAGKVDPECLKARGWVPVSPDRPEPAEPKETLPRPVPRRY